MAATVIRHSGYESLGASRESVGQDRENEKTAQQILLGRSQLTPTENVYLKLLSASASAVINIEHRKQLRNHQQILDFFSQIDNLSWPPLRPTVV